MRFCLPLLLAAYLANAAVANEPNHSVEPIEFTAQDWPWWRGPQRDGTADPSQAPPLTWSNSKNVLWRAPVPGRGHGSTTVVGDRVFLQTADEGSDEQSVICLDRNTGQQWWETVVHEAAFPTGANERSTMASATPACDGHRVFVNFLSDGAVFTTALDLHGKQLWQRKISDYVLHQGYGSSPALYQHLVIVSADNKGGGAIVALNRNTGETVWERSRPEKPNYSSPVILRASGRDQLFLTGCDLVTSLDPLTGEEFWQIKGATTECVTTPVTDGEHVFTSGGYPENHVAAVATDGSGETAWRTNTRVYVPSMLVKDNHLYAVLDAGVVICHDADTGAELWKERLGGTFNSSPVLVGERIYATNQDGETFIFKATPDGFHSLGTNQLGENVFATPAICGSQIFMRVSHPIDGKREEFVYCLGDES